MSVAPNIKSTSQSSPPAITLVLEDWDKKTNDLEAIKEGNDKTSNIIHDLEKGSTADNNPPSSDAES